jgi:hypothetical protein
MKEIGTYFSVCFIVVSLCFEFLPDLCVGSVCTYVQRSHVHYAAQNLLMSFTYCLMTLTNITIRM